MAIGIGLFMGFKFPVNFDFPYAAKSITEFWRRWHISLSSWFRDYLYIPLGGNRKGKLRTYFNLIAVFFLCGLWHGASFTFIAWGMYHGCLLIIERIRLQSFLTKTFKPVAHLYTLTMVIIGWILFRSETFEQASTFILSIFGLHQSGVTAIGFAQLVTNENLFLAVTGMIFSSPAIKNCLGRAKVLPGIEDHRPLGRRNSVIVIFTALLVFLVCSMYILAGTYNPFIYFRF